MSDPNGLAEIHAIAESFLRANFLPSSEVPRDERLEKLRPTEADYAELFGDRAAQVQAHYAGLWVEGHLPEPKPGQTELEVFVADAAQLGSGAGDARRFPGGYREIVHLLPPQSTWIGWVFRRPGKRSGQVYDGLVSRPAGRFCWFPKPWRVLAP
jgi:hypothetical protein